VPGLGVRAAPPDPGGRLPWRWGEVLAAQLDGRDPTGPWRAAVAATTARQYAAPAPAALPAAFVLQWVLEVPALLAVAGATLEPGALAPVLGSVDFDLHPGAHFPDRAQVAEVAPAPEDADRRWDAAHGAYLELAAPFARAYDPGVRLGRRTRLAMVDDVWAMARRRVVGGPPPARGSCCFVYALPGARECAGCPRLRSAPPRRA
jgi:hypothetical protein